MADEQKPQENEHKAHDGDQANAPIADLPQQDTSKDADQVKGGRAWDIPAGTASPSS